MFVCKLCNISLKSLSLFLEAAEMAGTNPSTLFGAREFGIPQPCGHVPDLTDEETERFEKMIVDYKGAFDKTKKDSELTEYQQWVRGSFPGRPVPWETMEEQRQWQWGWETPAEEEKTLDKFRKPNPNALADNLISCISALEKEREKEGE